MYIMFKKSEIIKEYKNYESSSTASHVIRFMGRRLRIATVLLIVSLLVNIFSVYDSVRIRNDNFNKNKILIEQTKNEIDKVKDEIMEEMKSICACEKSGK